ncbi:MAG: hypothetical protein KDD61_09770 [Bdellovibrionales bacterium]|nr:hypothetical protein [Bdellovibrionales bacterium]
MKCLTLKPLSYCLTRNGLTGLALFVSLLLSSAAFAWGERGHHLIGHEAARLIKDIESTTQKKKGLGYFFNDRCIQIGHLSNIPDTSWKIFSRKKVKESNFSTHFIDPEVVLGLPDSEKEILNYTNKIKRLPNDYKEAFKKFNGKQSHLPESKEQKVQFYKDVGTGPWHSQFLYDQLVKALRCGKNKKTSKKEVYASDIQLPLIDKESPVNPTYICKEDRPPEDDFHAAVALAGVLSHFIADLAQPLHTTANYDGWHSGHGKIHVYFESLVLQLLGEDLNAEVAKLIRDKKFQDKIWKEVGLPLKRRNSIAQLSLNLTAQSYQLIDEVEKLDNTYAIIVKGKPLPWSKARSKEKNSYAPKRKPADDATVLKAFRPLIVKRLAVGSFLLAKIWMQAWNDSGKPDLSKFNAVSFPYLFNVPYIWPDYAQ